MHVLTVHGCVCLGLCVCVDSVQLCVSRSVCMC